MAIHDAASGEVELVRADAWRDHEALSLLLTGRTLGGYGTVERFREFAREQGIALDELWTARLGVQLMAAAMVVPSAGRTGMLFLSPLTRPGSMEAAVALLRHVCRVQDPAAMRLLQALLDIPAGRQGEALASAGFAHLAELVYMQRRAGRRAMPLALPDTLAVTRWPETTPEAFGRAILASYVDTRDCPALLGLRHIDDILAGHMASGQFLPEQWLVVHQQGEPAAVMLLNGSQSASALDVVYLGVSPAWRRRGLARELVRYALGQARVLGLESVSLAVDDSNAPAVGLYGSEGFTAVARKIARIFALP